jgi:hypothetical protein
MPDLHAVWLFPGIEPQSSDLKLVSFLIYPRSSKVIN